MRANKKLPKDREAIRTLKRWLAKPGNTKSLLAGQFGYQDSTTVDHWIGRGRLPGPRRAEILKFLEGGDDAQD